MRDRVSAASGSNERGSERARCKCICQADLQDLTYQLPNQVSRPSPDDVRGEGIPEERGRRCDSSSSALLSSSALSSPSSHSSGSLLIRESSERVRGEFTRVRRISLEVLVAPVLYTADDNLSPASSRELGPLTLYFLTTTRPLFQLHNYCDSTLFVGLPVQSILFPDANSVFQIFVSQFKNPFNPFISTPVKYSKNFIFSLTVRLLVYHLRVHLHSLAITRCLVSLSPPPTCVTLDSSPAISWHVTRGYLSTRRTQHLRPFASPSPEETLLRGSLTEYAV
ncbi:hypothetical protein E2C01_000546 [Portunus trituberculatus]|uniref:Uncharacterized protein n=1 Tax=Portunus trituberculatus TaxID=210409 RepID=A0A5B7CEZ4_PORTR|nr:hypothetical protein [Portunus trituberculatus]